MYVIKKDRKKPIKLTCNFLLVVLMLVGCQSSRKIISPPPYLGIPQEVSTYEIKGLSFGSTISFLGVFAEDQLKDYAIKNHYRYYVITTRHMDREGQLKKITAMMYR